MFGIGMPEMILILVIILIVFGPQKLPDLAKALGRAIGEFRKATSDFKESIELDDELKDVKKTIGDINNDIKDTINSKVVTENSDQNVYASYASPYDQKSDQPVEKKGPKEPPGSLKDERG